LLDYLRSRPAGDGAVQRLVVVGDLTTVSARVQAAAASALGLSG
jgi:hypothetical protein